MAAILGGPVAQAGWLDLKFVSYQLLCCILSYEAIELLQWLSHYDRAVIAINLFIYAGAVAGDHESNRHGCGHVSWEDRDWSVKRRQVHDWRRQWRNDPNSNDTAEKDKKEIETRTSCSVGIDFQVRPCYTMLVCITLPDHFWLPWVILLAKVCENINIVPVT